MEAARPIIEERNGALKLLESWTGMANHCSQLHPVLRPLLQRLYSFLSATAGKRMVCLPRQVKAAMMLILTTLHKKQARGVCIESWSNSPAASDGSGGVQGLQVNTLEQRAALLAAWASQEFSDCLCQGTAGLPNDWRGVSLGDSSKRLPSLQLRSLELPFVLWRISEVGIGGWWVQDVVEDRKAWFAERVPVEKFPWVLAVKSKELADGGCSSTTAELLAMIVLLDLRLDCRPQIESQEVCLTMGADGDNAGCCHILRRMYTGAEPGASLMRYVAARSTEAGVKVKVRWTPREFNQWADVLSKGWEGGPREEERKRHFDDANRKRVSWERYLCINDDVRLLGSPLEKGGIQVRDAF